MTNVLAFDLGGTRLKAGVVDDSFRLSAPLTEDLPPGADADAALDALVRAGRRLLGGTLCRAAGVCVPGLVSGGVVTSLHGKLAGLAGRDLPALVRAELGLEAVVSNDAIAYGVGEALSGAGAGHRRVVVTTIGTGVGVAVIEDGRPLGSGPLGGGLLGGFIPIASDGGPADSIGRTGTIEALCAARRLVDLAGGVHPSVPDVLEAYGRGEPSAAEAVKKYRERLARALAALAHAHAPHAVVVGGGPLARPGPLLEGIEEAVNAQLWPGYRVSVRAAELGDTAALVGLAHMARA